MTLPVESRRYEHRFGPVRCTRCWDWIDLGDDVSYRLGSISHIDCRP